MDNWRGPRFPYPDLCHLLQRPPGRHCGIKVTHLLPPRHWDHLLSPDGVLGTHCFLFAFCLGRETTLPTLLDPSTQLHFQGHSSHSSFPGGANLSCFFTRKPSSSQSGNLYFLCSPNSRGPRFVGSSFSRSPRPPAYWFQHVISFANLPGGYPRPLCCQIPFSISSSITGHNPIYRQAECLLSPQSLRGFMTTIFSGW